MFNSELDNFCEKFAAHNIPTFKMTLFFKTISRKSLFSVGSQSANFTWKMPSPVKFSTSVVASSGSGTKPIFSPHDALQTDSLLTEEEVTIRDVARDYARNELMPRILMANRNEVFDREIFREMGKLGFLGCTVGYVLQSDYYYRILR